MRVFRPIPIAEPIGRIVASVIAARHAREMKGARQVAARRARYSKTAEPVVLHDPQSGHGERECPGEITPEIVGAICPGFFRSSR